MGKQGFPGISYLFVVFGCVVFFRMMCFSNQLLYPKDLPGDLTSEISVEGNLISTSAFISTPHFSTRSRRECPPPPACLLLYFFGMIHGERRS